jgi:hypothetical protein
MVTEKFDRNIEPGITYFKTYGISHFHYNGLPEIGFHFY